MYFSAGQRQAHTYYSNHLWRDGEIYWIEENKDDTERVYSQDLLMIEWPVETRNRLCHSRESGNPGFFTMFLDPRFRGGDNTGCIFPFKNQ